MTTDQLRDLFEKHDDKFLTFYASGGPFSSRRDLTAFKLLDALCPATGGDNKDIVSCSNCDEIVLNIDVEELANAINEEQVIELIRCGVRYNYQTESLYMFT